MLARGVDALPREQQLNPGMVRAATLADLTYIDSLQRKNATALSFYPKTVFERESGAGRVVLNAAESEPIGYCWHGAPDDLFRVHQACIQFDVRGMLHGAEMMRWCEDLARAWGCRAVTLRCAADIEANGFWRALGYACEAIRPGGIRRSRDINCWTLRLTPELFAVPAVEPSTKRMSMAAWTAGRGEMRVSRFHRRGNLLAFRKAVTLRNDQE